MDQAHDWERLTLDYGKTSEHFRMLADVRFKLLALVPTMAGIAMGTLAKAEDANAAKAEVGVGVLGWFVTLGLILYELRNTQHYDAAVQRLKCLELLLGFPATRATAKEGAPGGVHRERPKRWFPIIHDLALGIVYAASLGGWTFLSLDGLEKLKLSIEWPIYVAPVTIAVVVGALVLIVFWVHDCWIDRLRTLPQRYQKE